MAQDRRRWRAIVYALCDALEEEEEEGDEDTPPVSSATGDIDFTKEKVNNTNI